MRFRDVDGDYPAAPGRYATSRTAWQRWESLTPDERARCVELAHTIRPEGGGFEASLANIGESPEQPRSALERDPVVFVLYLVLTLMIVAALVTTSLLWLGP